MTVADRGFRAGWPWGIAPLRLPRITSVALSGIQLATTDPLGNVTQTAFDPLNRQIAATDAIGYVTTTSYDAIGRQYQVRMRAGTSHRPFTTLRTG